MPNHCNNTLTVCGPTTLVRDFAREHYRVPDEWARPAQRLPQQPKTMLDFSVAAPYPSNRSDADGWYDWQIENWGTKWNAYDIHAPDTFPQALTFIEHNECSDGESMLEYHFDTAWSPPMAWLHTAREVYPDLTFTLWYTEEGMGFCGVARLHRQEHIHQGWQDVDETLNNMYHELLDEDEYKLLEEDDCDWEAISSIVQEKKEEWFDIVLDCGF